MSIINQFFDRDFIFQSFHENIYKQSNAFLIWIDELYDIKILTIDNLWNLNWENLFNIILIFSIMISRILSILLLSLSIIYLLSIYFNFNDNNKNTNNENINKENILFI